MTTNGRAAFEPVALLGTLIFQFLERAPDRQAADLVRYHLGWKLALNLELGERGFHATTLVTFRQRLLDNEQGKIAFDAVLEALQAEGLVPKRGKQRLDSTHVPGLVARMSRLECISGSLTCIEAPGQTRDFRRDLRGTAPRRRGEYRAP